MSGFVPGETPEGWYADAQSARSGVERWWNGVQWTAHTRLVESAAAPPLRAPGRRRSGSGLPISEEIFFVRGVEDGERQVGLLPGMTVHTPYGATVAGSAKRLLAWVIDVAIVWGLALLVMVPLSILWVLALGLSGDVSVTLRSGGPVFWWVAAFVCWGYHVVALARRGASLGQWACGLGVRPWRRNARLTRRQVLLRAAFASVVFVFSAGGGLVSGALFAGLLSATVLTGRTRRGLHEIWSDTCTVTVR